MFFDLIQYKIHIIRPNTGIVMGVSKYYPMDIPGRVLGIVTKNEHLVTNFINKHRLLEAICGDGSKGYRDTEIRIRWDNDVKGWYDINSRFVLLSSCYPSYKSIWSNDQTAILRDLRPAAERRPLTIKKSLSQRLVESQRVFKSFSKTKKSLFNEYYGCNRYGSKEYIRTISEPGYIKGEISEPQLIEVEIPQGEELESMSFRFADAELVTSYVSGSYDTNWSTHLASTLSNSSNE